MQRSERSREAIVQAIFELVGEGVLQPTAEQVAGRAGVGIRTVFRHFSDMESLFVALDERLRADVGPLFRHGDPTGGIAERVRGLVEQRAAFFERIAPYRRAARVKRWRSDFLQQQQSNLVRELRRDLRRWLPELTQAPAELVEAIDLVTCFESWDRLRSEQGLGRTRAEAVMERMLLALVPAASSEPS